MWKKHSPVIKYIAWDRTQRQEHNNYILHLIPVVLNLGVITPSGNRLESLLPRGNKPLGMHLNYSNSDGDQYEQCILEGMNFVTFSYNIIIRGATGSDEPWAG
jgi:hypothetical protein